MVPACAEPASSKATRSATPRQGSSLFVILASFSGRNFNAVAAQLLGDGEERLLVALGPAPSLMLAYLADPDHKSTRRWPLRTSSQAARAGALERLSPAKREVLVAVDAPLSDVLSVFSDG